MKTYQTNEIKNIALLGNSRSGKTTFSEAVLFNSGVIDRRGDVESKNTVSDYHEIEHQREASVVATVLYAEANNKKINIIDIPGMDDFVGEVISSLHVTDTALFMINAQNGVEVGTDIQFRLCEKYNKPIVFVINHLDHEKANFDSTIDALKTSFGANVVLVQYPIETGDKFDSIIDVITMRMYKFSAKGGKPEVMDIPASEMDRAVELQTELIEKAAENDENLMELFFENDTLTEDEMRSGIKTGLVSRGMFPVFCASAKKNMGVERILEFLSNVAPSPNEIGSTIDTDDNEVKCDSKEKPSLFVFKSLLEPHIGEVNYFKVMSGDIIESIDLVNNNSRVKERLSQIFASAGKNREKVAKLCAGDIGSTVKLKGTKTNHTLTVNTSSFTLPKIDFPEPKYRTAIKPTSEGDEEKLGEALNRIHDEDPTIIMELSKELKQTIVYSQGEYHLNMAKWKLDNIFKIETEFLAPKIPYRETITKAAQSDYRHKKQSGGSGQFGEVHMIIEPFVEGMTPPKKYKIGDKEYTVTIRATEEHKLPWGGKIVYNNCIVGGSIDARFLPAILKGIMEKMENGPLTGSYARDIVISVYDGKMHPVDSNELSFKLAGRQAFSAAFKNAGPKIMEPVYDVEVLVPADRMGDVMSDLQGRRAIVQGMSSEKGFEKISAKVPLAEMSTYATALSSISGGRAMYSMKFDEYAPVPGDLQSELLKAYEAEENEE